MKIQTNGIHLHVTQSGTAHRALVFLHYYGGSSRTWGSVIEALSGGFRTVALDQRGWGRSEAPANGYRMQDLADDALGVIEALGLKHYVLVGHSMGGKVAQLLASRRPAGLEAVVLVAPSPPSPMVLSPDQQSVMAGAYTSPESVMWVVDNVLTDSPLSPAVKTQVIEDSLAGAPQARQAWPETGMAEDITAAVGAIAVPVLVLSGDGDQVDRTDTLKQELMPRIPGAQLKVLPRVGHLLPLEAPLEVASSISDFLRAIGTGS